MIISLLFKCNHIAQYEVLKSVLDDYGFSGIQLHCKQKICPDCTYNKKYEQLFICNVYHGKELVIANIEVVQDFSRFAGRDRDILEQGKFELVAKQIARNDLETHIDHINSESDKEYADIEEFIIVITEQATGIKKEFIAVCETTFVKEYDIYLKE